MNYKQKYEEALERATKLAFTNNISAIAAGEIFPELRESEDERIRKGLINMLSQDYELHKKEIAWLEKQGEQKPIEQDIEHRDLWEYINEWRDKFGRLPKDEDELAACIDYVMKRQKPSDKVEPKFKVGDYIERKDGLGCHAKIICIGENVYGCEKLIYPEDSSPFFDLMFENQDEFRVSSDFQQKPSWSEEDEKMLDEIIKHVRNYQKIVNPANETGESDLTIWLKSIKPQKRWKPSEQNIKDLEWCADLVKDKMGVGFHRLQVFIDELKQL